MEVRCDKCQARYRVDDARIGPQGLSMRCGKCQNVFRVMPPGAAAAEAPQKPVPPAPKTLPRPNATAIFAAPPLPNSIPSPAKPPPQAAAAGRPPRSPAARVPPTSEEAAGRTMMFPTANLPSQPAAAKKAPVPSKPAAGGTMVFGESPAKSVPPPVPARGPKPAAKAADAARSTMMFGAPQPRIQAAPAAAVPTPEPAALAEPPASPEPALEEPSAIDGMPPPPSAGEADGPAAEAPAEAPPAAEVDEIAGEPGREPGTFDRAPPRALLVGVAAGLVLLLAVGGGLVAYRKLGRRAPPAAAVETLSAAQAEAEKDSLASIASAETKARDALDVAGPRARFPEATAALARVEIQWADALADQASRIAEKNADDPRAAQLQAQAKTKVKAAFDLLAPAAKANAGSPDVQLAFADYYRAKRLPSSMSRYLKEVKDEPRVALIEGLALLQEDDGAEKALPKLKAALAASPQSARIHYRLALAHLALKDEGSARTELKETLRLSPQHERAQALLEQLGGAAERK